MKVPIEKSGLFEKECHEYSQMTDIRLNYQFFQLNRTSLTYRDVASFLTSCGPGPSCSKYG